MGKKWVKMAVLVAGAEKLYFVLCVKDMYNFPNICKICPFIFLFEENEVKFVTGFMDKFKEEEGGEMVKETTF